jgi:translation initiation factor 2B subunit (eIF-2B alpha/beta/delta family)
MIIIVEICYERYGEQEIKEFNDADEIIKYYTRQEIVDKNRTLEINFTNSYINIITNDFLQIIVTNFKQEEKEKIVVFFENVFKQPSH